MELDFAISGPLVQPRMPHIRFLSVRSRPAPNGRGFLPAATIAATCRRTRAAAIAGSLSSFAFAVKAATMTIPFVFSTAVDPVAAGLVARHTTVRPRPFAGAVRITSPRQARGGARLLGARARGPAGAQFECCRLQRARGRAAQLGAAAAPERDPIGMDAEVILD